MTPDPFAAADAANAERQRRAEVQAHARRRDERRDHQPMPAGSLFDEVTRSQQDLFRS